MENQELNNEIRKEFQLDRIILFTDAVFAIVITLTAIEIRLPEHSDESIQQQLFELLPVIFAYVVSFLFIGQIWYQHLKLFSLIRDFDKGLIVRNLLMLFWLGFLPFSVTLIARKSSFISICIYFSVIFLCRGAQLLLQHYILVKRPNLRHEIGMEDELLRFKKSRLAMLLLAVVFILVTSTMLLIDDPELSNIAWWWFVPFPSC
ncbi:TMEM175 family protein [Flavobacterium silvaticum]|uniref:DUF1211 domain-containing protein n=1 Tax=Flavobacterium silvaticum TaxID=1852020 RepID=A0A972FXQ8_9FLAO|nr:TMEM175 family protein [Flavobacterium silvaticum]NMH26781.1 DUF1211 domain-containing protein [Flavobacterium silvaticum]